MPRRTKHYLPARGEAWDKARMRALVRDDFQCQAHRLGLPPCGETRLRHLQVHHKIERQHGGTHDLDNLLTVCASCHSKIHPHMLWQKPLKDRLLESEGQDDTRTFELPPREL
jgi:5-methylcytosine-specific restriction endonuclease McrA